VSKVVIPLQLAASLLAAGCTSCNDSVVHDAAPEVLGADVDTDHDGSDGDVDSDQDVIEADLPDGALPMQPTEIPHDRLGMDCGRGCRQISFADTVWPYFYEVGGRYLVYENFTQESTCVTLFLIDLETLVEYQLLNCDYYTGGDESCGEVTVNNETISFVTSLWDLRFDPDHEQTVWLYYVGDSYRTPLVRRVSTAEGRGLGYIRIHRDMIAWYDSHIPEAGLYVMNLDGGEITDLTPSHCNCYGIPNLWGRQVVYEDFEFFSDIFLVNIDTLEHRNLNNDLVEQWDPSFDGQWVAWTDGHNDPCSLPSWDLCNPDIFGMEMPDGEIEPLCDHPAAQTHPDVHLGLVAWEDFRNAEDPNDGNRWDTANVDIYLLDLETRREMQVTNLPGPEIAPRIWGRRLFFMARDLIDQWAIFVVDLDEAGVL
jgi:hypothetical protein